MPRVTRRVLASKKEEKVEETQPARSGGRGAKRGKPEPVEETLPIGEPSPSKAARSTRGKEAPPKVETPKANTSRTSSRGRGKKEEEPEPEEEIEEEEAPPPKKGARGGKGKKDEPEEKEKAAPPKRGGRGKKEEVTEDIDETPPTKRAARGGRGQKQDEPEEEEEAPTPKRAARGGRGKKQEEPEEDKEEETPPPKRAARAVRGKKEEPEDVEEEAKPAPKRAARGGRGSRGKKTEEEEEEMDDTKEEAEEVEEEAKPAPKRAARGVRGSRGKKTEEEEEEMDEAKEETEEVEEETKPTPKRAARGGRGSRGKKTEVNEEEEEMDDATEETEEAKPAPKRAVRGGRGSRGKKTELNEEENEEEKVDDAKEEEKVDDAKEETEAVEESPKGRKSRTPTKPEVSAISPSSGGRRSGGRGKKEEVTSPKITPPRSSNKETVIAEVTGDAEKEDENDAPHEKVTDKPMESEELTKEEEKDTSAQIEKDEEMEVDKNELEAVTMEEEKKEETVVAPVSEKDEEIEEAEKDGNKKRKHDDDAAEEESSSKKARVSEAPVEDMPAEEEKNNDAATDFVIVNKEDVPPADSKEVEDALPPPVEEKPEATPEKAQTETEPEPVDQIETEPSIPPSMAAPIIVPLTEAEIGKQCNPIIMDRDENSSTMVEVGSEAASDSGNMSRNLDVSEVTSMDVTSAADQLGEQDESNLSATSSESAKEELSSSSKPTDLPNELPQPTPPIAEEETTTVPEATEPVVEVSQSNAVVSSIPLPSEQSQSPVKLETQPSPVAPTQQSSPSPPIPSEAPAPVPAQPPTKNTIPELQLNSIPLPPDVSMSNSSSDPLPLSPQQPQLPQSIPPLTAHNATNQNGNCKPDENVAQTTPIITPTPAKKPVVLDSSYVPSSPSIVKRKFISNSNFPIELMDPAFCFSVVSYNLLADCHLRRYNYSYTEPQYLEQSYRHSLFLKELEYLDGDIVCMQEVDTDYYQNLLLPAMNSRGYQGVFKKRTQEWYAEGEATFVKSAKFEILSHQGLSLKDLAYEEVEAAGLTGDVARAAKKYLDRADVVLVCKLLSKKTGKHLTVGNIHVLFDPKAPDIQCIQVASAVKELVSRAGSDLNPYIICGDFNSETTSPSYQLAKDGYLSDTHIRNLQSIQSMDNTEGSSRSIIHYMWKAFQHTSSNMKSAYETSVGKEPVITSLNSLVKSCLDYIFYSSSTLYTVGALEVLDPQVVEATGGLPSKDIPSDHLSVKAVFRLKD